MRRLALLGLVELTQHVARDRAHHLNGVLPSQTRNPDRAGRPLLGSQYRFPHVSSVVESSSGPEADIPQ